MNLRLTKLPKLLVSLTACFCVCAVSTLQSAGVVNAETIKPTRYVSTLFKKADIESDLIYGQAKNYKGEKEDLKLDVYQPSGDNALNRASIIFVHGGGLVSGSKSENFYKSFIMEFVKKGYVVFSMDYRLRENQDQFLDAMKDASDDAALAVQWVQKNIKKYRLDNKHIAFMGHSAGSDIINNLCYNDKMSGKLPKDSIFTVVEIAGSGLSVFTDGGAVKKGGPSCFIVHGTQDEYVPCSLSEEFAEALRQSGTPYAIHILKDGTHVFREDFYEVVDEVTQFLNNQLMGFNIRINKQLAMEKILQRRQTGIKYKAKQIEFKVDGKLDEWGNSSVLTFDKPDEYTMELPSKSEFSGTAMIGWNEKDPGRIYIAAVITDDVIQNNIPADGWWRADDTIEIRTDLSEAKVLPSLLWAIGATGDLSETANKENTEIALVREGTTTTYEIAIDLTKANVKSAEMKAIAEKFKCEKGKMIGIGSFYDDTETWQTVGWVNGAVDDRLSYVNVIFD